MWTVLSRFVGGLWTFLGLVLLMFTLPLGMRPPAPGEEIPYGVLAWFAFGMVLQGAVPFLPGVTRKRWSAADLAGVALCTAAWHVSSAAWADDITLVALGMTLVLALPGVWLVRRGWRARPPAAVIATEDGETEVSSGDLDFDAKMEHLKPTPAVVRACITAGIAGATTLFAGLQLVDAQFRVPLLKALPYALMLLGGGLVVLVSRAFKMHELEARGALVVAALLSLVNAVWFVLSLKSGFVSLFGMLTPWLSVVAAFLFWRAMPAFKLAGTVRRELEDAGMDLGF